MKAAEHRERAAEDRASAAADRAQGAIDRSRALADRTALARALAKTERDPLTGARTRVAGLIDLDREVDRSLRTGQSLVVAYVDAVGLKQVNDQEGHEAGDRLLQRVTTQIAAHLRSYDLVVRLAGDEFLCAMPNMTLDGARERFSAVAGQLATAAEPAAIRTGFAQLAPDETASELMARADQQLISSREH